MLDDDDDDGGGGGADDDDDDDDMLTGHVTAGNFIEGRADGWCLQLHDDGR